MQIAATSVRRNAPLRKWLDGTNREGILPRHDFRRYQNPIRPAEEEFAAVASPAWRSSARGRNLPLPFGLGEGSHVNLGPAGLVGKIGQPASVWRKLSTGVRVGRVQVRALSASGRSVSSTAPGFPRRVSRTVRSIPSPLPRPAARPATPPVSAVPRAKSLTIQRTFRIVVLR